MTWSDTSLLRANAVTPQALVAYPLSMRQQVSRLTRRQQQQKQQLIAPIKRQKTKKKTIATEDAANNQSLRLQKGNWEIAESPLEDEARDSPDHTISRTAE